MTGTLAAGLLAAGPVVVPAAEAAPGDTGTIAGQVFRDYDGDGEFDAVATAGGPREMGLENVVVRVTDTRGRIVAETTTALGSVNDPGGAWSIRGSYELALDDSVSAGDALRLEFRAAGYDDTFSATPLDDNASVRFLSAPAADLVGVDYGVSTPEDYSTGAPPIVSAIQSAGSPARTATPTARNEPAVVSQYWRSYYTGNAGQNSVGAGTASNAAGVATSGSFPKRATLATFGQVGAVWGTAYQNTRHNVFTAATYKRLSGLGPLGIGGIYRIPVADTVTDGQRTVASAGAVEPWLNVQGLPISNVPGATVDLGPALDNAARGLDNPSSWVPDPHAFANAGRIGIGSITVSADQRWLYFVNLFDRNVYRIDITDPAAASTAPHVERVTTGLPVGSQPWALTEHHDRLYVGYVHTGAPWQSAAAQGSHATVVSTAVADIDPAAGVTPAWESELTVDLAYQKGPSYNAGTNTSRAQAPWLWRWNSWVDTWTNPAPAAQKGLGRDQPTGVGYDAGGASWNTVQTYPQAILSDIEFSDTNDLVIGLMDRTSLQAGNRNRAADDAGPLVNGRNNNGYEAISSGDTLIAALNASGDYVLENNGALVDGRVTARGSANEGVGGREFFSDTNMINGDAGQYHRESTLGGIAAKTGYNGIISAVIDPLNTFNVTGLKWLSTDNGDALGGYQHTAQQTSAGSNSFQKAGGLGNIQALSEEAPLQIGDRVWFDANRNGIQDAGEPPLAGVVVTATRADGSGVPLEATTDANGNYLFDSRATTPLLLHTDYVLRFAPPAVPDATPVFPGHPSYGFITWGDLAITSASAGAERTLDSNPDPVSAAFSYRTGAGGQNDHSLDAGYFADLTPTATIEKFDGEVSASGVVSREGEDADTFADGAVYPAGSSRTVVIRLENTGPEPLKNVVLTDASVSGSDVTALRWWLPGETAPRPAQWDAATRTWTYTWAETSDADAPGFPERTWPVGDEIVGEATVTVAADDAAPHRDEAAFTAAGAISGNPVSASDPYSAFTGDIQIIKYDGADSAAAPVWRDSSGGWIVPDKDAYGADHPEADADTADDAVSYLAGAARTVRYLVTNSGNTWLTDLELDDITGTGQPEVTGWTADLSALTAPDGAPAGYPATQPVEGGALAVPDLLFGPGQSFVVTGSLTLQAQDDHRDDVSASATVVVPAADSTGAPNGSPAQDADGPVRADDPDDPSQPFRVDDDDPFHARASAFFVQKAGAGGAALGGSAFQLREDDTSAGGSRPGAVVPGALSAVTGETGRFLVAGLAAGTYWLEEVRAPEGHALLPRPVKIAVTAESIVTLDTPSPLVSVSTQDATSIVTLDTPSPLVSVSTQDATSTVTVSDVPALGLPLTGDTGPAPYLVIGGLLLAAALGVVLLKRRRAAAA